MKKNNEEELIHKVYSELVDLGWPNIEKEKEKFLIFNGSSYTVGNSEPGFIDINFNPISNSWIKKEFQLMGRVEREITNPITIVNYPIIKEK
jgi:hypothetical protein